MKKQSKGRICLLFLCLVIGFVFTACKGKEKKEVKEEQTEVEDVVDPLLKYVDQSKNNVAAVNANAIQSIFMMNFALWAADCDEEATGLFSVIDREYCDKDLNLEELASGDDVFAKKVNDVITVEQIKDPGNYILKIQKNSSGTNSYQITVTINGES